MVPTKNPGHSLARLCQKCQQSSYYQPATTFFHIKSRRLTFFVHLARTDENADASQAIFEPPPENDHRGGRAQPGWWWFMMTCLRWILGYTRQEIWHKIGLSGDWCIYTALRTRSGACYYWISWQNFLCGTHKIRREFSPGKMPGINTVCKWKTFAFDHCQFLQRLFLTFRQ